MLKIVGLLLALLLMPLAAMANLSVLTYHDVVADPAKDSFAISKSRFVEHMDYLEKNGYRVMSLKDVREHLRDKRQLPHKAVMLTFDDGLSSYANFVVPVLRSYAFPSVAAVVTSWLDGKQVPQEYTGKLMSWEQLKAVAKQPLVEVISHSNNLHHGISSNPQGNEAAAAVTRQYFPQNGSYETEERFRERVAADLQQSVSRIQAQLGVAPMGIAWPYGQYDQIVSREADLLGLTFQFNLEMGDNNLANLPNIKRIMLVNNPSVADLANELSYHYGDRGQRGLVHLNLDDFAGLDNARSEALLGSLLEVLQQAKIKSVVINPIDRNSGKAYFYTDALPVEADVLNRITHQLLHRVGIREVFIDMPAIAEKHPKYKQAYEDLARLVWFSGVVMREKSSAVSNILYRRMLDFRPGLKLGFPSTQNVDQANTFVMEFATSGKTQQDMNRFADRVNNMASNVYLVYKLQDGESKVAESIEKLHILGINRVGVGAGVNAYIEYQKQHLKTKSAMAWVMGEKV